MADVYNLNFRAEYTKQSGFADKFSFAATDEGEAAVIKDAVVAVVASQLTSWNKRVFSHNLGGEHPLGTLYTMKAFCRDDDGRTVRFNLRNLKAGITPAQFSALFLGTAYVPPEGATGGAANAITALSAPPVIPWSLTHAITKVNADEIDRN